MNSQQIHSSPCECDLCVWSSEVERLDLAKRETMIECSRCKGAGEIEVDATRGRSSASLIRDTEVIPCPANCDNGRMEVLEETKRCEDFTLLQIVAIREALSTILDDGAPWRSKVVPSADMRRPWAFYPTNGRHWKADTDASTADRMAFIDLIQDRLVKGE